MTSHKTCAKKFVMAQRGVTNFKKFKHLNLKISMKFKILSKLFVARVVTMVMVFAVGKW
jgi:hypothetical protein